MNAWLQNAKLNCQVLEHWLSPKDFFRVQSISFNGCKSSVLSSGHCLHWFHPAVLPAYPQNLHHRGSLVHSSHNRKHCVSSPQNWRSKYWESQTGQNSPVWEHKHNQFLYLQWEECTLGPISVVIHHLPSNPSHSLPFLFTRESAARGRYHPQEHFKSSNQVFLQGVSADVTHKGPCAHHLHTLSFHWAARVLNKLSAPPRGNTRSWHRARAHTMPCSCIMLPLLPTMLFHNELDEGICKCRFQLKITLLQTQRSEVMTLILIKLEQLPH